MGCLAASELYSINRSFVRRFSAVKKRAFCQSLSDISKLPTHGLTLTYLPGTITSADGPVGYYGRPHSASGVARMCIATQRCLRSGGESTKHRDAITIQKGLATRDRHGKFTESGISDKSRYCISQRFEKRFGQ